MPRGRPYKYNRKEVLLKICDEMAKGDRSLTDICNADPTLPQANHIYGWVSKDQDLMNIFLRAQQLWCLAQRDLIISIADDQSRDILETKVSYVKKNGEVIEKTEKRSDNTAVNRDRLRVGARQWAMTKLYPKLFGDKVASEVSGPEGKPVQYEAIDRPPKETQEEWTKRIRAQIDAQKLVRVK